MWVCQNLEKIAKNSFLLFLYFGDIKSFLSLSLFNSKGFEIILICGSYIWGGKYPISKFVGELGIFGGICEDEGIWEDVE